MTSGPAPGGLGGLPPVSADMPEPAEWLSPRAREIFATLVKRLQSMNTATATHTESLCLCASRLADVERLNGVVEEKGSSYETQDKFENLVVKARPEYAQRSEAMRHAAILLAEMGLTVKSRGSARASPKAPGQGKGSESFTDM